MRPTIEHHGYKPHFKFYTDTDEASEGLFLGVELETEYPETCSEDYDAPESREEATKIMNKKARGKLPYVYCQEDGSLSHGVEFCTHPATLKYHQKHFPILLARCRDLHFHSADTNTCGLHVHISRGWFSRLEEVKLGLFIFSHETQLSCFGRRSWGTYCPGKPGRGARLKAKNVVNDRGESRYSAVNYQNAKTIELRFFKGTLNEQRALATLEFCHAVSHWVKVDSIRNMKFFRCFLEYVKTNEKQYANLIAYMVKRGLM